MTRHEEPLEARPLTLNALLESSSISPNEVLVFRHKPSEPQLNFNFEFLVSERRDLFECYQSTHASRTEAALKKAKFVASFIRFRPKLALFVGLYRVAGFERIAIEACLARPLHRELMTFGLSGDKATDGRSAVLEFDLRPTSWNSRWSGRLIVKWPGLERSWYRWADRNEFEVETISEEDLLARAMPAWDDLILDWQTLAVLPVSWKAKLSQWRGIYLIVDRSDGKQYVGSAYGTDNLLQRWLEYARTGHGGNKFLRDRNPENFRFSILQLLSPVHEEVSVTAIEAGWKKRLFSRAPAGLNEN